MTIVLSCALLLVFSGLKYAYHGFILRFFDALIIMVNSVILANGVSGIAHSNTKSRRTSNV